MMEALHFHVCVDSPSNKKSLRPKKLNTPIHLLTLRARGRSGIIEAIYGTQRQTLRDKYCLRLTSPTLALRGKSANITPIQNPAFRQHAVPISNASPCRCTSETNIRNASFHRYRSRPQPTAQGTTLPDYSAIPKFGLYAPRRGSATPKAE